MSRLKYKEGLRSRPTGTFHSPQKHEKTTTQGQGTMVWTLTAAQDGYGFYKYTNQLMN